VEEGRSLSHNQQSWDYLEFVQDITVAISSRGTAHQSLSVRFHRRRTENDRFFREWVEDLPNLDI